MKLSQARIGLLMLVALVATATSGCGVVNKIRAKSELNEAAHAYRDGKFAEAEQHSRRALELDPNQPNAPRFIARTVHAQYKQGVDTPQNIAKANDAITAYKQILARDPNDDEAYKAIAALYHQLGQDDKRREWIAARANDQNAPPAKRAEAYTFLASEEWQCSYNITEQKDNKQATPKDGKTILQYIKPKNQDDFNQAQSCVTKGLEEVNTAINLDPNNDSAWGYKTNLLLEAKKLAEMEGNQEKKADYTRQAEEAQARTKDLAEQKKAAEAAKQTPTPPST